MNVGNLMMGVCTGVGIYFAAIYIVPYMMPYVPAEYWPSWLNAQPTTF